MTNQYEEAIMFLFFYCYARIANKLNNKTKAYQQVEIKQPS